MISNNHQTHLEVTGSIFYDQIMIGEVSSLINNYASGSINATGNIFFEIGYMAGTNTPAKIPRSDIAKYQRNFTFQDPAEVPTYQYVGIFDITAQNLMAG